LPRILPLLFVTFVSVSTTVRLIVAFIYIVVLGIAEYYMFIRPQARLDQRMKAVMDFHIGGWVAGAKYFLISEDPSPARRPELRVNVMLMSPVSMRISAWLWDHGASNWLKKLLESKLTQVYEYGMSGHPDANLDFAIDCGFCGQCLTKHKKATAYVRLDNLTEQQIIQSFGLSAREYQRTNHITAITCTTLVRRVKRLFGRSLPEDEYFGVLNIDAIDDIGRLFLAQPSVLEEIRALSVVVEAIYQ
jgi:hypothetical protein